MKIRIWQIDADLDENHLMFRDFGFTRTQELGLRKSIYNEVFCGEVDCKTLEEVYKMFNMNKPEGYKGRSVSVSDVIEVDRESTVEPGLYYVDWIGFSRFEWKN